MKNLTRFPVVMKCVQLLLSVWMITSVAQGQSFPTSNNCASKDLDLIETILRSNTENSLWSGNRKMMLTVTNKTGNDRKSFALWGNLKRYDINGNIKSVTPVFFCVDTVKKYATASLAAKDSLYYVEGEELVLTNIYTAWSSTRKQESCSWMSTNTSNISPNCAVRDSIKVYTGVNTRMKVNRANCGNGKGSIHVNPFGGRAPYYVSVALEGSSATETRTVRDTTTFELAPGRYRLSIMDSKNNMSYFTSTIDGIAPTEKPKGNITHPTCDMPRGKVKVANAQNNFSYALVQNGQPMYTSNSGDFTEVEAGAYELTARWGTCFNNDTLSVNKQPYVPAKPDVTVVDPTCTRSTGDITVNNKEKDITYKVLQNAQPLMTLGETNMFGGLSAGDYEVLAYSEYCSNGVRAKINVQPPTPGKPVVSVTQASLCANGSASITSPVDHTFQYSKDGVQWQDSPSFPSLASGSGPGLSFQVKNSFGCISESTAVCGTGDVALDSTVVAGTQNVSGTEQTASKYLGAAKLGESTVVVKTIPNPFSTKVRFMITAPEAGNGVLELYNIQGQKVKTIYQGHINAGSNYFDLTLPERRRAELIYVLKMTDTTISGKLMQLNDSK